MEYSKYTPTSEYLNHHLELLLAENIQASHYNNIRRFYNLFSKVYGSKPIGEITASDINMYTCDLEERHLSPSYIRTIWQYCNMPFEYAYRKGILPENPFRQSRKPTLPKRPPRFVCFTDEEVEAILMESSFFPSTHNMIKLAFYTGLRPCELAVLTWDCVDWEKKTLLVRQHYTVIGKSNKDNVRIVSGGFNKRCRLVTLPNAALDILQDQKICQNREQEIYGPDWKNNATNYIFTIPCGTLILPSIISNNMQAIKHNSGVKSFNFTNIRHHFGITAARSGIDPNTIRIHLGQKYPNAALTYWAQAHDTTTNNGLFPAS